MCEPTEEQKVRFCTLVEDIFFELGWFELLEPFQVPLDEREEEGKDFPYLDDYDTKQMRDALASCLCEQCVDIDKTESAFSVRLCICEQILENIQQGNAIEKALKEVAGDKYTNDEEVFDEFWNQIKKDALCYRYDFEADDEHNLPLLGDFFSEFLCLLLDTWKIKLETAQSGVDIRAQDIQISTNPNGVDKIAGPPLIFSIVGKGIEMNEVNSKL